VTASGRIEKLKISTDENFRQTEVRRASGRFRDFSSVLRTARRDRITSSYSGGHRALTWDNSREDVEGVGAAHFFGRRTMRSGTFNIIVEEVKQTPMEEREDRSANIPEPKDH
jgi:hypothetical protein